MIRALVLLVACTAAVAAPVPKALKKPPDYCPVPLGGVWIYGTGADPNRHSIRVSDVQTAAGEITVVRRYRMGESDGPLDVCRVSAGEVREVQRGKGDAPTGRLFLRPGMKPGDTWVSEYQLAEILDVRETFTVGEPQQVTVPAGTFTAVPITCKTEIRLNGEWNEVTRTDWYGDGVGLIGTGDKPGDPKNGLWLQSFKVEPVGR